jgi:hypothetical protein
MMRADGTRSLGCGSGSNAMRTGYTGTSSDKGHPARPPARGTAADESIPPTIIGTGPIAPAAAMPIAGTRIG